MKTGSIRSPRSHIRFRSKIDRDPDKKYHGNGDPACEYTPKTPVPTYAFSATKESADRAAEAFRKVKDLTVKLSMVENAAYRLASNIKKTQKRANALQNITIPMYTQLVSSISNALEEKDREEFTRLKVIKRRKQS